MFVDLLYCILFSATNLFTGLSRVNSDSFCFILDSLSFIYFIIDRVSVLGGLANLITTFFGFGDRDLNHKILSSLTFSPMAWTLLVKSGLFDRDVIIGFLLVFSTRDSIESTIFPVVHVHVRQCWDIFDCWCWTWPRFSFVVDAISSINLNNLWEEKESKKISGAGTEIKRLPEWEVFEARR